MLGNQPIMGIGPYNWYISLPDVCIALACTYLNRLWA